MVSSFFVSTESSIICLSNQIMLLFLCEWKDPTTHSHFGVFKRFLELCRTSFISSSIREYYRGKIRYPHSIILTFSRYSRKERIWGKNSVLPGSSHWSQTKRNTRKTKGAKEARRYHCYNAIKTSINAFQSWKSLIFGSRKTTQTQNRVRGILYTRISENTQNTSKTICFSSSRWSNSI